MVTRLRERSGSIAFPAPRSSLPVAWRDLRVFRSRRRLRRLTLRSASGARPSSLRSLNEPDDIAVIGLERPRSVRADHLSWDSYGRDRPPPFHRPRLAPGLSVIPRCPLPRIATVRSRGCASQRVPTSWFRTTSPVYSTDGLAGLLHPAADRRVRCVSSALRRVSAGPAHSLVAEQMSHRSPRRPTPHTAFRTPRRIPPTCSTPRVSTVVALSDFSALEDLHLLDASVSRCAVRVSVREVLSLRALLCRRVRTIAHRIRVCVGLPSLGLVPLRSCLRVGLLRPDFTAPCARSVPDSPLRGGLSAVPDDFSLETHSVPCRVQRSHLAMR
jgi:hypothetical protein